MFEGAGEFSRVHAGRNVPFGIREHAMGAIVNGAAAHGGIVKPYGSTFLIFSDYMRGAVRLSALMGLPVRVGLDARLGRPRRGRPDAPAGRALRGAARDPAPVGDPPRRRERDRRRLARWRSSARTARSRCCSRARTSPVLDRAEVAPADGLERGGYVLWDSGAGAASPELILIATGAEVAADARRPRGRSPARGRACASCRCRAWSCSKPRRRSTATQVLPRAVSARLAVEPGATMSWWKWVGSDGDVLGLDRFGASAPGATVLEKLGFTAENIAARARALLDSRHD